MLKKSLAIVQLSLHYPKRRCITLFVALLSLDQRTTCGDAVTALLLQGVGVQNYRIQHRPPGPQRPTPCTSLGTKTSYGIPSHPDRVRVIFATLHFTCQISKSGSILLEFEQTVHFRELPQISRVSLAPLFCG